MKSHRMCSVVEVETFAQECRQKLQNIVTTTPSSYGGSDFKVKLERQIDYVKSTKQTVIISINKLESAMTSCQKKLAELRDSIKEETDSEIRNINNFKTKILEESNVLNLVKQTATLLNGLDCDFSLVQRYKEIPDFPKPQTKTELPVTEWHLTDAVRDITQYIQGQIKEIALSKIMKIINNEDRRSSNHESIRGGKQVSLVFSG